MLRDYISLYFQVLLTTMQHHPETVQLIVKACLLLHNLMRTRFSDLQNQLVDKTNEHGELIPGAWRQEQNLIDTIDVQGPNRATRLGKRQRNLIKHWCCSDAGSVPWQEQII